MNFSNAMSSYTAQNIGAGKIERVKDGYKANMFMVVVFSGIITLDYLPVRAKPSQYVYGLGLQCTGD